MNLEMDSVNTILEFFQNQKIENIAIALMQLELRDGHNKISVNDYQKFKEVYNLYLDDNKYAGITGLLNEVLQNADSIYDGLLFLKENDHIKEKNI